MFIDHLGPPLENENGDFIVGDLSGPLAARQLIRWVSSKPMDLSLGLDLDKTNKVYPNGAVPFACALDFMREQGRNFHVGNAGHERALDHVLTPMEATTDPAHSTQLTNVVWKYQNEQEAAQITKRFMGLLLDKMPCETGVYDTLNWCIFEVLDNVFQHSQAPCGFVMMQLHATTRQCVISVSDYGIGIHRAMAVGVQAGRIDRASVMTASDAIAHAIQQGVTSKGNLNQGNGLFGLSKSIEINGGLLAIHSGRGTWKFTESHVSESESHADRPLLELESHHGTTVDWQLDCRNSVSIGEALGSRLIPSDLVESIETIDGYHELDAADLETSIGSRKEGRTIRTRIVNYLNAGAPQIVLNMARLETISSSFADEVLGMLAVELGESEYKKRIAIWNASHTNLQIIARAVELRIATAAKESLSMTS